jgi:branched-chain amino acid transport system substrate-binding protein
VIVGGTTEAYKTAIANWEKLSGRKVHLLDVTPPPGGDFTPFILKFRDRGCQAVVTNVIEPNVVQWVKTAEAQRIKGIDWLFLAPGYTAQVAKALAGTNQSVYAATEWEPFTGSASPAIKEWRAAMTEGGLALTAFTQGGYLAGTILVQILRGINGPVTRESVTNALRSMKAINHPLVGTPYYFGPGRTHASLKAVKIVKLVGDNWQVATPNWIVLP